MIDQCAVNKGIVVSKSVLHMWKDMSVILTLSGCTDRHALRYIFLTCEKNNT